MDYGYIHVQFFIIRPVHIYFCFKEQLISCFRPDVMLSKRNVDKSVKRIGKKQCSIFFAR